MVQRELYKCADCKLEVALVAPVERPCPRCGGLFTKVHPLDFEIPHTKEDRIDAIVAEIFPELIAELEEMLAAHANEQ